MSKPFRLPLYKRLLNHPAVQYVLTFIAANLVRLIFLSCRVTRHIPEASRPYMEGEKQAIFCFWHGRMIVMPFFAPKGHVMHVLISHHRDGAIIARLIGHLGLKSIRGSSSKGGMQATRDIIKKVKAGDNISITPDGPRGPARKVQEGAVRVAQLTRLPLIAVSYSVSRGKHLNSWDRFMIPWPFSHIVLEVAEPVHVNHAKQSEIPNAAHEMLEMALNHITDCADSTVGRSHAA